jgi:hypothetical protein
MQESSVLAMVPGNYVAFSDALETQIHNTAHVRVGGTMVTGWSPEAPEFFLHHNHVDKLWDDWQKKSNAHLTSYSFALNAVMPVAYGATPAQFNNLKATKVIYVRASPSVSGAGHLTLFPCGLILVASINFDLAVMQASLARASAEQLRQIPQLAAPILTSAEEKMMIDMARRGGGSEANVRDFTRRMEVGREQLTKANEALKAAGNLRTSFENSVDKALGFDVAAAVKLLKIPPARSTGQAKGPIVRADPVERKTAGG